MKIANPVLKVSCMIAAFCAPGRTSAGAADAEFFEQKIRPVLVEKCFECHSADAKNLKGNLLLDSREGFLKGGDTGPSIVPGSPEKSLILSALRYEDPETAMPPKKAGGKLPDKVVADFTEWVKNGAPWPAGATAAKKSSKKFDLAQRKEEHWCWKPPVAHAAPSVQNTAWAKSPSDAFILAKLEGAKLAPAPRAQRATLLRRISFDLTGLPPAPADIEALLSDTSPEALERYVDRLLASEHFGERWARHWMDLVRYADSRGHEFDYGIPNAWQYRDYLVRAFNNDVPYNQFVKEAIAGDLISPRVNPATGANESVLGTGFWFLGEEVHSPVDIRQDEVDRLDNRLDVMGKSFLGITLSCARCHDHKFDAISQKDYYGMMGFLVSSSSRSVRFETIEQERIAAAKIEQLRAEAGPTALKAYARAARPAIKQLPAILNAARDRLLSKGESAPARNDIPDQTLTAWTEHLKTAQSDAAHPLHKFASAWLASPSRRVAAPASAPVESPAHPPTLIADYTQPNNTAFLQDGFAFGERPVNRGTPILGTTADKPLTAIVTHNSARRDEVWSNITSKGDPDAGSLKDFQRSGQTLRTPEITLGSGQLWYLVRGAGRAYAAVNSHSIIAGPLHGRLLTKWKDAGRWEWVAHDLRNYQGHRAHVELMPDGAAEFAVAMVVEAESKPPLPRVFDDVATDALASSDPDPVHALHKVLSETLDAMEANKLSESAPALSVFANWLVGSTDLICPKDSPERRALTETMRPWTERQAKIAASFKRDSQIALAMFDGTGADEFLLKRGSTKLPVASVSRRFLEALEKPEAFGKPAGSGRLQLAERIASPSNPLTSRVIVNRVWHHLFGRGIVPTVDNLGVLGQSPSHPELLDALATRFTTEQQWSLKKLIRELVLSSAYAMSSSPADAAAEASDPENLLLHRMNLKRLEGEAIRDAILVVSGRFNPKMGGPSVPIFVTAFMDGRGRPATGPLDGDGRRSLYIAIRRNFLSPMMLAFDTPIPFNTMGRRNVSNVPAQSLVLMNDPFVVQQAEHWAKSLPPNMASQERVKRMYASAFGRFPLPEETEAALAFVAEQAASLKAPDNDLRVWADLGHAFLNAKEFIHLN